MTKTAAEMDADFLAKAWRPKPVTPPAAPIPGDVRGMTEAEKDAAYRAKAWRNTQQPPEQQK